MAEIRWTFQAAHDLDEIVGRIAEDSPSRAGLFAAELLRVVDRLAAFPGSGRVVPELGNPGVREVVYGNYRIVYRRHGGVCDLLTIFHGARLLRARGLGA